MTRLEFDWDKNNIRHIERHGIRWQEVEQVFRDPAMLITDEYEQQGEDRWEIAGKTTAGRLLRVVFTIRSETIRAVTAMPGNRTIKILYEGLDDEETDTSF